MKIYPCSIIVGCKLFCLACLLTCIACTRPVKVQTPLAQFLSHFPARPDWPDTLHCFLSEVPTGAAVSDTLLKTVLDSTQFESLHFGTGDARFWALGQFPFANGMVASLLQTEEFWFGKQNLLVFDPRQQTCLAVMELAHFYGGDGGQTASESWLFRNKKSPQLYVKNAEHWIAVSDTTEELQEQLREQGRLLEWQEQHFRAIKQPDSLLFLQQFRLHRTW